MSTYKTIPPISTSLSGFAQPITDLCFDPVSDIIWAGLSSGMVTAYLGTRGVRGPCFRVGGDLSTKRIVAGDSFIHASGNSNEGMGSWTKGGVNKWFVRPSTDLVTFSNTPPSSTMLAMSLLSLELLFVSTMTGATVRQVKTSSVLTQLEMTHSFLLSGSSDGYLRIHDPRTGLGRSGGAENLVKAHARSVQRIQTVGNFVFTIGMGERQSRPFPDPLVKVYDLRTMRSLPPIPFSAGPAFIHAVPKRSSGLVIVSNEGLINIVDVSDPAASNEFYQLDIPSCVTSSAISPTAAYMAFGDGEGMIHLMSQAEDNMPLNGFEGQPVPMADMPAPLPEIDWVQSTPLSSIGMPYFDSQLLSAWPATLSAKTASHSKPNSIPPQVLETMKYNDNVAYAALPKELRGRRNMTTSIPRRGLGRFRSDKVLESEVESTTFDHIDAEIPRNYRHVEIEYSKFGVEDFDFGFYNKTDFSGLETHILNSYTNAVVQIMHYMPPIRRLAKAHITVDCPREHCLLCELGFISRMLEDAHGTNCQASNFCKTVGVLAQAFHNIEIVDYGGETSSVDYAQKIQAFHRFLVDHLNTEANTFPHNPTLLYLGSPDSYLPSPITQLLGINGTNITICSHCKGIREKPHLAHIVDLIYPLKPSTNEQLTFTFSQVLRNSLFRPNTHKMTCQICKQLAVFTSTRSIASFQLPPLIAVNASVYNDESFSFWQDSRGASFLPPQISVRGQIGGVDDPEEKLYEVRAIVVKIAGKDQKSHLVAIVRVPEAGNLNMSSPWYLFNDFVVKNISQEEALSFPGKWKVPSIVYLERNDLQSQLVFDDLPSELDATILSRDTSISMKRDPNLIKHDFLRPNELPTPGTLVAIDAEFVSMQQEETEFRSDGTKKVLRPARLSLARVSVLRGSGLKQGVPFIDDHIHTSEMIVDYLTEFSGIKSGDLDPTRSPYTLTPLKLVYKKLRLLVDRGCIFIGHGLSKDFRIINIYVPPEQVIDTVDLYFLKARQRRLSLRFLSWYILGEHIQTETHDSIEDARSALRLYNAYQEFEEQGIYDKKLEEIYREGRQMNFKPPPDPSAAVEVTETPTAFSFTQSNFFKARHIPRPRP